MARLWTAAASLVLSGVVVLAIGAACGGQNKDSVPDGRVSVVATFYPLFEAAQRVGGQDLVTVRNLVPAGVEPHDFEPTPKDIILLQQADVVVYNDAGLEPWLERVLPDLEKKGTITLVDASRNLQLLETGDEEDPSRRVPDPHFWLDPVMMQGIVVAIRDALVQADPGSRVSYEANAASYSAELGALHQEFVSGLGTASQRSFVTTHAAFGYLARRYNLQMIPISGLSPDAEPSPRELASITQVVRERGIRHIFFETLVSPRLAQTIAQEVGAETLVLNPLEGLTDEEAAAGENYVSVMRQNLANLKKALGAAQ